MALCTKVGIHRFALALSGLLLPCLAPHGHPGTHGHPHTAPPNTPHTATHTQPRKPGPSTHCPASRAPCATVKFSLPCSCPALAWFYSWSLGPALAWFCPWSCPALAWFPWSCPCLVLPLVPWSCPCLVLPLVPRSWPGSLGPLVPWSLPGSALESSGSGLMKSVQSTSPSTKENSIWILDHQC